MTLNNLRRCLVLSILALFIACGAPTVYNSETIQAVSKDGRTEGYNESRNVFFGDLHIHTGWSFDAYMSNVRVTPDDAYRFGRGEAIAHVSGKDIQMKRPLDFMAVADHAEYMGGLMQMDQEGHPLYDWSLAQDIRDIDPKKSKKATRRLRFSIGMNWPFEELIEEDRLQDTWKEMVRIADQHNDPGVFTAFPAYEWTSSYGVLSSLVFGPAYAQNLHRNVIFKGGKVSALPFSSFDSQYPEDLWKWMDHQRDQGVELLAIPHNANISDGRMYALETFEGKEIDADYIAARMRNEPVNEVVQIKGQSMSHPALSPNDEFADFELYQFGLGQANDRKILDPNGANVRQALTNGLKISQEKGANPFQFGIIGSSDSHNGGTNVEEDNQIGRSGDKDPTATDRLRQDDAGIVSRRASVAGLAAVWAKENTRDAIFEALERKEVYATSGPRMKVRFFASSYWGDLSIETERWDSLAYTRGIPMGSQIDKLEKSPSFLISAIKDPEGANLDRVQVVKGWVDQSGQTFEKIYDVAWSDDRPIDESGRLSPVGNSVNLENATYTNDIGAVHLQTKWTDPEFNGSLHSYYYLRVLEIPTPRWTTYDAVAIGVDLPEDVPSVIQERAWSSPIWYNPN